MKHDPNQHRQQAQPDNDDLPIGRILSRREILKLIGGAGAALITVGGLSKIAAQAETATPTASATALPACVVRPAKTEGPYFVDEMLNRSDIRVDTTDGSIREGVLLNLIFRVSQAESNACTPLEGAQVDVWHCDALGNYSDVEDQVGHNYLRGYQLTDEYGQAQFLTIYPGWYSGRTVHIHFKIRTDPASDSGYEFTSQLFFPDDLSREIYANNLPYSQKGEQDTSNAADGIYADNGDLLLLDPILEEDGSYTAVFDIALDLSAESTTDTTGFDGRPGGGPPNGTPPPRRP
ncbi:MAG: intradiol ring-cleavage dioxygenase [Anaerolineae bacterium]